MINAQFCVSHIGKRRSHEDNFLFSGRYITPTEQKGMLEKQAMYCGEKSAGSVRLFAVSDGMGGHSAGEIASYICVSRLAELESTIQNCSNVKDVVGICKKTIADINSEICAQSLEVPAFRGMGATLVLLIVCGAECAVLNIGDSRAYLFDGVNLTQITKDHTEGQRMLDLKLLTSEEVLKFSARKNVNRYVGFSERGTQLMANEYFFETQRSVIMLCSDGISDFLTDSEIEEFLKADTNIEVIAKNIIERAVTKDGSDNATIILISIKGGDSSV